jgi:16S rRNA U1498 N3-methylase RsmE
MWPYVKKKKFVFFDTNGKYHCKERHHIEMEEGLGKTSHNQPKPQSLQRNITIQRWLITPSNLSAIM